MKKLHWMGLAAILLLVIGAGLAVWRLVEGGEVREAVAAPPPPSAPEPAPAPAAPAPVPDSEVGSYRVEGLASDRDPRNDVQRPADPRADLLQAERAARTDAAMDQLNRRSQKRRAAMQNIGEVKPPPRPPAPGPTAR